MLIGAPLCPVYCACILPTPYAETGQIKYSFNDTDRPGPCEGILMDTDLDDLRQQMIVNTICSTFVNTRCFDGSYTCRGIDRSEYGRWPAVICFYIISRCIDISRYPFGYTLGWPAVAVDCQYHTQYSRVA